MRGIILTVCMCLAASVAMATAPLGEDELRRGEELYRAGKWHDARRHFTEARRSGELSGVTTMQRLDSYIALCAIAEGDDDADALLKSYMERYPYSVYDNEIHFAAGCASYKKKEYDKALKYFAQTDVNRLGAAQQDEFYFKEAHSKFVAGRTDEAYDEFGRVSQRGEYAPHARYYTAYIDYSRGDLNSAKAGFASLADDASYRDLVPFYLLQIEFMQENYDYVTQHCDALIDKATPVRRAEIERIAAEAWFHLGDYSRTISYLEAYSDDGGTMDRQVQYLMGYSLYRMTEYERAAQYLQSVCGPDDALTQNAAYHLGDCRLRMNDKLHAMQAMALASSLDFDEHITEDALFNYGKLQYELGGGTFNEAVNILTRYIDRYPDSPRLSEAREYLVAAYYNSKNYDAAYRAIKQMDNPDNNIKSALQKISYFRALELYNNGDYDGAEALLEESLENSYNAKYTALAGFWQGELLMREGRYDAAAAKFRRYLQLAPKSEPEYEMSYYNLGYALLEAGNRTQARAQFDNFLWLHQQKDVYRADALNRKGDILYAQRSFDKAIEAYNQSAAIASPERDYALYQRAVVLGLNGKVPSKIEALRAIVASGEGRYVDRAAYELGRTYVAEERYREGADAFNSFLSKYPDSEYRIAALTDLGLVYQNLGDNDRALESYKRAVALAPNSSQARDAMAGIRGIYVDNNDVGGYFAYARTAGVETDLGTLQRDSLTYAAAQRLYTSGKLSQAAEAFDKYLKEFDKGNYRADALYYGSDCHVRQSEPDKAIEPLKALAALPANAYTLRGAEKLAQLADRQGQYDVAAEAYLSVSSLTKDEKAAAEAIRGYVRSTVRTEDDQKILEMAGKVHGMSGADQTALREADFACASIYNRTGRSDEALAIYRRLSSEVNSAEGAESAYRVIEAEYKAGNADQAEKLIYALSEAQSPQTYWVARAFIVLGDIYRDKGDDFQARATYRSIVDGYSPADDGIVEEARQRIESLNQ